ncbi:MAG: MFS transporter [Acidobacteriaceae bacterium]
MALFASTPRGLKLIFLANLVSMAGSGMNSAAVIWYILQATHSEASLGLLMMLQSIPALLMLPFSGVLIDRNDRRHVVMILDASRLVIIAVVAGLALTHRVHVWQVYAMYVSVALGFWMFWPTINALIQELTPAEKFVQSNTLLMAGIQGGFLISGALVGFIYDHIGLGGVLVIDACSYVFSFSCFLLVRRGRQVVLMPAAAILNQAEQGDPLRMSTVARFLDELREGFAYLKRYPAFIAIGLCWSLFLSAMISQNVITAPISERILHAGAVGFGWLNMGWGIGAFASALVAIRVIGRAGPQRVTSGAMAMLAISMAVAPFSRWLGLAVLVWFFAGLGRGIAGIAISSEFMEQVPKHLMGRVQNIFYFLGTLMQIALALGVGAIAHRISLTLAAGVIGAIYGMAFLTTLYPQPRLSANAAVVG